MPMASSHPNRRLSSPGCVPSFLSNELHADMDLFEEHFRDSTRLERKRLIPVMERGGTVDDMQSARLSDGPHCLQSRQQGGTTEILQSSEYSEIVEKANRIVHIRSDCWGAFVFVIVNDLPDVRRLRFTGEVLLRVCQAIVCYVLNIGIQLLLLYYIHKDVVLPAQLSAQNLYKQFHRDAFAHHVFSKDEFDDLDLDTKNELCQLAIGERVFFRVILFLWYTANLGEAFFNLEHMLLVVKLPALPLGCGAHLMVQDREDAETGQKQHSVVCMDRMTKITIGLLVYIPKLVIVLVLTWAGKVWLLTTESISKLVLNSLALAFVTQVDELIASAFFPDIFSDVLSTACWAVEEQSFSSEERKRQTRMRYVHMSMVLIAVFLMVEISISYQAAIPNFRFDIAGNCQEFRDSQMPWCDPHDMSCFPES